MMAGPAVCADDVCSGKKKPPVRGRVGLSWKDGMGLACPAPRGLALQKSRDVVA